METGDARPHGGQRGQEGAAAGRASTVEEAALWADETPVGRLADVGSAALSVRELLALLLRARGAREDPAAVSARLMSWPDWYRFTADRKPAWSIKQVAKEMPRSWPRSWRAEYAPDWKTAAQ